MSPEHFGLYFSGIGIVFFIGSIIAGHSAAGIGTFKTVLIGAILMLISGLCMFVYYQYFGLAMLGLMGPMIIMGIGGAMVMGGGAGGAIAPFPAHAGMASALFGATEFMFAFLVPLIVMARPVESTLPLAITMMAFGGAASLLCLVFRKRLA